MDATFHNYKSKELVKVTSIPELKEFNKQGLKTGLIHLDSINEYGELISRYHETPLDDLFNYAIEKTGLKFKGIDITVPLYKYVVFKAGEGRKEISYYREFDELTNDRAYTIASRYLVTRQR